MYLVTLLLSRSGFVVPCGQVPANNLMLAEKVASDWQAFVDDNFSVSGEGLAFISVTGNTPNSPSGGAAAA